MAQTDNDGYHHDNDCNDTILSPSQCCEGIFVFCMTDRDEDGFGSATPDEGINADFDCNDADPMLNREDADGWLHIL